MMDQAGRGKGDLLSGVDAVNTVTGTKQWPHQLVEPSFSWNNVYTPKSTAWGFGAGNPTEIEGRDYYNLGAGFTADSTPTQVSTILVAGINGQDYVGTYTYPHPLVSGVPSPPSNLRVAPSP
jgi:hypothetical protein